MGDRTTPSPRRVLVIGGTGFIGPWAVRSLVSSGHEVTVVHRGETEADLPDEVSHLHHEGPFVGGRLCFAELDHEFRARRPDVVLDMTCGTAADAYALTWAFRGVAERAVVVSSVDVYRAYGVLIGTEPGDADAAPLHEGAPLRRRLYPFRSPQPWPEGEERPWRDDYEKVLVERVATAEPSLPVAVVRLPMVHGPGSYRYYDYVRRMQDGRPFVLLDEGGRSWRTSRAYVEDVGRAIAAVVACDLPAGAVLNVGDPEAATTELEWVRRIAAAMGWDGEIAQLPTDRLPPHLRHELAWRQPLVVDDTALREATGYAEATGADEGLARTVAWQLATPPEELDRAAFDYPAEDDAVAPAAAPPVPVETAP